MYHHLFQLNFPVNRAEKNGGLTFVMLIRMIEINESITDPVGAHIIYLLLTLERPPCLSYPPSSLGLDLK